MTQVERWLLPDGIEEILPPEAANIEFLRRRVLDLLGTWGYDLVIPPMAEYLESLLTGVGHDVDLLTFKITDQLTGRLMGLSADNTQQVARMDVHSLHQQNSARYCYSSPVLHTRPASIHASRSPIQVGAELYGIKSVASDIEIVSLMLEMLQSLGIDELTLDLGHVAIYHSLTATMSLPEAINQQLYRLVRDRSIPDLEQFIAQHASSYPDMQLIADLSKYSGSRAILREAYAAYGHLGATITGHLDRLNKIADAIEIRYPKVTLNFDLAELKDYNYHTGLVFSAFTPTFGHAVAKGGRYDATGTVFGNSRPATGFSADLKVLAKLVKKTPDTPAIFAPYQGAQGLHSVVTALRQEHRRVIQAMTATETPEQLGCNQMLVQQDGQWVVKNI